MESLKKTFLFTVAVVSLVLVAIFGLYFDLGALLRGGVQRSDPATGVSMVDRLLDGAKRYQRQVRTRRAVEVMRPPARDAAEIRRRYLSWFPSARPPSPSEVVASHADFLRRAGLTCEDYIALESLAKDRSVVREVAAEVRRLVDLGYYDDAVDKIETAIRGLDPRNLRIRRELLMELATVFLLRNDLEKAKAATDRLTAVMEKICEVRSRSSLMKQEDFRKEVEAHRKAVALMKEKRGLLFESLRKRKEATGRWDGYLPEERTRFKAALLRARADGTITAEQFDKDMAALDGGFSRRLAAHRREVEAAGAKAPKPEGK